MEVQTDLDGVVDSSSASSSNDSSQKALLHGQSKRLAPSLVVSRCSVCVGIVTRRKGIVSHAEDLGEIGDISREQFSTLLPSRNRGQRAQHIVSLIIQRAK